MKNLIFASLIGGLTISHAQAAQAMQPMTVAQDQEEPTVFYNSSSIPEGIFKDGQSVIAAEKLAHTVTAWDLNGVVFDKKYSILENYRHTFEKYGIGKTMYLTGLFGVIFAKKIYYKYMKYAEGFVWDAMFQEASDEQTYSILRELALKSNNPDQVTATILQELHRGGHDNVVLSNMGQGLLDAQLAHFVKKIETVTEKLANPDLSEDQRKNLLYQKKTLEYLQTFLTQKRNVVASKENGWLHKPDRESYQTCLNNLANVQPPHTLKIFIDDKIRNITAALEDGLFDIAILFTSPEELRRILHKLGKKDADCTLLTYAQHKDADKAARADFEQELAAASAPASNAEGFDLRRPASPLAAAFLGTSAK